jgi:HAD superfamily hydrolase (TIGR01549 family)
MTIKAVIFDLDGTIASFNLDYKAVRTEVRSFLVEAGVPSSVLALNESIFEMLKKTEVFLKNHGKTESAVQNVRERALAIAEKHELEAAKSTSLLPGVVETLKALRDMRLKLGLCTINGEKSTDYILKRFRIAGFFDAVVPRNRVRFVKPSGEHLEAALKALEVNAAEAVIVGDGSSDMKCAKELNVMAVGLPTGVSSREELAYSGANYLITKITDLPTLIDHANRTQKT